MNRILTRCLAAAALAAPLALAAQGFPDKPIHLVVPYAPGGTTDIMARVLQEPMQKALGQPIVIDNKPGASGVIAAREVIRSKADGYTLFFVNSGNLAVTPFVVKDANYDGLKDFSSVALVSTAPLFVVVPASLPVDDLRGFIAYAKTHSISYASAGIGSFGQLSSELFATKAGIKMTHIPYKGQAPTTNAVIAGDVQLLITTASSTMNDFIASKKLKLLAVTSAEPSTLAPPNTPTVSTVLPGYVAETWFAIIGPAGMPADIVDKLNAVINKAMQAPDVQQRFSTFGVVAKTATPKKLAEMTADDIARWTPVIRDNHISAE
jgi:tripartite-type tricarboxylate transporter receptor subunit TctC